MASVFTKIINRELPGYFVYEDEWVAAFLTIEPVAPGHILVVPKTEVDFYADVPEPFFSKVYQVAQPLGKALKTITGAKKIGQAVIGLEVPHFHLHLIPINSAADLDFGRAQRALPEDLLEMQNKVIHQLKSSK